MKRIAIVLGWVSVVAMGMWTCAWAVAVAPEPELFLSWNAPFGDPRASDHLTVACDDTSRIDTLYLSFIPGGRTRKLASMSGVLYFHPQSPDTLGPFWWFKRGWANETNLRIDFDRFRWFPCPLPWDAVGYGEVAYDHRSGRGRLDLSFRIQEVYQWKTLVPEERYCFARVMIRHLRDDLMGCHQPVCVEFTDVRLNFPREQFAEIKRGENRFVTWNAAPGVSPCDAVKRSSLRPWQPKSADATGIPGSK